MDSNLFNEAFSELGKTYAGLAKELASKLYQLKKHKIEHPEDSKFIEDSIFELTKLVPQNVRNKAVKDSLNLALKVAKAAILT